MDNKEEFSDKKRDIAKEALRIIAMGMTGKNVENTEMNTEMSISEDGELEETGEGDVTLEDGSKIKFMVDFSGSNNTGGISKKIKNFVKTMNDEAIKNKEIFDVENQKLVEDEYKRMGLIEDFSTFHGVEDYQISVLRGVKNIHRDDFFFLCSAFSDMVDDLGHNDSNAYRVCPTKFGEMTKAYKSIKENGCCKNEDRVITNTTTGNKFMIGCHYDHIQTILKKYLNR